MLEPSQLAAVRRRLGLSQAELAKRSGVSQSLIAKIESGRLDPTFAKMKAISAALAGDAATRRGPTVADVMQNPVVSMFADETVEAAIGHLARHGFSQLPVIDQGVLVGTVTEGALLHHVNEHPGDQAFLARPVRDVMAPALPQVPPETGLAAVEPLLEHLPAVLVVANGRVQGIVTRADALRATAAASPAGSAPQEAKSYPT